MPADCIDSTALVRQVVEKQIELESARTKQQISLCTEVLSLYLARKEQDAALNKLTSFQYNPLRTIPIWETMHSRLLGDLLDPNGSHGQKAVFLEEFLNFIQHGAPHPNDWKVTVETGRVDICLWRTDPVSVVIIENKSNWAVDQSNQLYRYWYWNIHRNHPELDYADAITSQNFKLVYMTPSATKRPTPHSLSRPADLDSVPGLPDQLPLEPVIFTFDADLPIWFERCIKRFDAENERLRNFLQLYQEIW